MGGSVDGAEGLLPLLSGGELLAMLWIFGGGGGSSWAGWEC